MAVKACRSLTLILLLCLSVVAMTATVGVPTVVAASSSGSGTCGDPDSPKDTGPRPAATQASTKPAVTASIAVSPGQSDRANLQWMVVQQLLSALLGRPGLMR
jgi:hypothetical protein